ncbi:MAG TPA: hypothetical protein VFM09_11160 [Marmoricola sp.]|nr:hypothetical protein [Marmoricola sp.]
MRRLRTLAVAPTAMLTALLVAGCTTTAAPARHDDGHGGAQPTARASGSPRPVRYVVHTRTLPWHLPGPLAREAVVPLTGSRVEVAGGLLPDDTSSAATYTLDLASGQVQHGPALPVPVHDTAGASLGGHPVVLGGGNAAEQAVVQARSGHGWRVEGRLPTARSDLATVTLGGRVLVIGGYDGVTPALGDVLASRDGRHWSRVARLPVPVRYPGVAVSGGAVWVLGGERNGAEVSVVQRIDPATGRARVVGHLPHALGHEAVVALGRRLLVAGGRTSASTLTARMWWFDPATHRFHRAGRLPQRLADTAVVQGRGRAWLVGGETPTYSTRVLELSLAG